LVGIATPTVPLSCALATGALKTKPSVMAAASALRVFLRAFMYLQFVVKLLKSIFAFYGADGASYGFD
jgi:hypothetical protein